MDFTKENLATYPGKMHQKWLKIDPHTTTQKIEYSSAHRSITFTRHFEKPSWNFVQIYTHNEAFVSLWLWLKFFQKTCEVKLTYENFYSRCEHVDTH